MFLAAVTWMENFKSTRLWERSHQAKSKKRIIPEKFWRQDEKVIIVSLAVAVPSRVSRQPMDNNIIILDAAKKVVATAGTCK